MHKILFAIILALVMTLALVGVKRLTGSDRGEQPKTLMATGAEPAPPIPW